MCVLEVEVALDAVHHVVVDDAVAPQLDDLGALGIEQLAAELPAYWQRLIVRPGLTGFAQIRRGYETSMAEKLAHDLEWIADRSVGLYLRTIWTTALRILRQVFR